MHLIKLNKEARETHGLNVPNIMAGYHDAIEHCLQVYNIDSKQIFDTDTLKEINLTLQMLGYNVKGYSYGNAVVDDDNMPVYAFQVSSVDWVYMPSSFLLVSYSLGSYIHVQGECWLMRIDNKPYWGIGFESWLKFFTELNEGTWQHV